MRADFPHRDPSLQQPLLVVDVVRGCHDVVPHRHRVELEVKGDAAGGQVLQRLVHGLVQHGVGGLEKDPLLRPAHESHELPPHPGLLAHDPGGVAEKLHMLHRQGERGIVQRYGVE